MLDTLNIRLADSEGALVRLLGLVERRGFTVSTMEKSAAANGESTVTLGLAARDGVRSMDILVRQIDRLLDVNAVFTPEIAAAAAGAGPASHGWRQACPPRN